MSVLVFIRKEIMEIFKTSKIIVLPAVFIFFSMISALSARFTNEMLAMMEQQGVTIKVPDPVYTDSYLQFFKNLNFIGLIVLILLFSGSVADEKAKGTAALMLTKNLTRSGFLAGKLFTAITFFSIVYVVSAAICMFYTSLLFPEFYNDRLIPGLLIYWVFMVMVISVSFFAGTVFKTYISAAVFAFAVCIALILPGSIPNFGTYVPGVLQSLPTAIISGAESISKAYVPLITAAGVIIASVAGSFLVFGKQEL